MENRTYRLLSRYSEGNKEIPKGILSPGKGRRNRTVRFEFPSQVTKVRNISKELDEIASSLSVLKKPTAATINPARTRLVDAPISLVNLKSLPQLRLKPSLLPSLKPMMDIAHAKPKKRMVHKAVG